MASSDSTIKQAQDIKLCELCQEESLKWRCIDCCMCLCDKCKFLHLRIPATAKHQIVSIGTPLENVTKKIVIDNIPCKDHPEEKTILFCRHCDSLVCQDCYSTSHKHHTFDTIKLALDEKLGNLREAQNVIDANVKFCNSKTLEVKTARTTINSKFDESLTNIKCQEQELVDEIRKYSQLLQDEVEKERLMVNNNLLKIEKDIDLSMKNLIDKKTEIDTILKSSQGGAIFNYNISIKDQNFDSLPQQFKQFTPGTKSAGEIQEKFGSLKELPVPQLPGQAQSDIKFEVLSTFTTDLPYISSVIALDKKSAWINCYDTDILRKINIKDNNLKTTKELSYKAYDITINSNDEIVFSSTRDSEVKLLKHSGEITTLITVAPLIPLGIHITKDNNILVSVAEGGDWFSPTDKSQKAIFVYGTDGEQKAVYQYDKNRQRLFTYPYRITTNNNNDIFVIDCTSGKTGRVVALNKSGVLQWIYTGQSEINDREPFDPRGLATTSVGHIIISDLSSHALHLLSGSGDLVKCIVTKDLGIMWPYGLSTDNKDMLWMGCGTGGKETGAKLHIIKLY